MKVAVERQKALVSRLQKEIGELRPEKGETGTRVRVWNARKRDWHEAVEKLRTLKAELAKLSGTMGDPRIDMLVRARRVLLDLEERGIAIGPDGEKLLDDIEFHVSPSRLTTDPGDTELTEEKS
jgi:hypothetical protein